MKKKNEKKEFEIIVLNRNSKYSIYIKEKLILGCVYCNVYICGAQYTIYR